MTEATEAGLEGRGLEREGLRLLNSGKTNKNKMAAGFSGALQLTDLDDFITPSQVSTMLVQRVLFELTETLI